MSTIMQANIKKQLSEKNMTAAELERRTGIPHAVINILHGRSKNPSIRTAQAIAKELGCSVEDLISESDPMVKSTPTSPATCIQECEWNTDLYLQAVNAICSYIKDQKLNPNPEKVAECITEVYLYAQGGQNKNIDLRFVQWIVTKNL